MLPLLLLILGLAVAPAAGITLTSKDGRIALSFGDDVSAGLRGISVGDAHFALSSGGTTLDLPNSTASATVTAAGPSGVTIERVVSGADGSGVTVEEKFVPSASSVHCTVTVKDFRGAAGKENAPWTAPITTALTLADSSRLRLWAPWDRESSHHSDGSNWIDPLQPSDGHDGWWDGSYYYGLVSAGARSPGDTIVAPMATVLDPGEGGEDGAGNAGFSVLLDPTDEQLELELHVTRDGGIAFARSLFRFDPKAGRGRGYAGPSVAQHVFELDFVGHAGCWRPALAASVARWPSLWAPVEPAAIAAIVCGRYATYVTTPLTVDLTHTSV